MKVTTESQTLVDNPPNGLLPTDDSTALVDNPMEESESDPLLAIDDAVSNVSNEVRTLSLETRDTYDTQRRIVALEAWGDTLLTFGDTIPTQAQVATELILGLTSTNSGLDTNQLMPSLEAYGNVTASVESLSTFAQRLWDALVRLTKTIAKIIERIFDYATSVVPEIHRAILASRARLAVAKGGYINIQRTSMGRYGEFLQIRGMSITDGGALMNALGDIGTLVDAATTSHIRALVDVELELEKIANSESINNTGATASRLGRAFSFLENTALGALCQRPIGTDPRYSNPDYLTTASVNLIGNRTVFLTRPKQASSLHGEFGTTNYLLDTTKLGGFKTNNRTDIETIDLGQCKRLLDRCAAIADLIEALEKSGTTKRLTGGIDKLKRIIQTRLTKKEIDGKTANLLNSAVASYSAACGQPTAPLIELSLSAIRATITMVNSSIANHD